ncbi:hypothetical protein TKK_0010136 [Trichogramma kaykai]
MIQIEGLVQGLADFLFDRNNIHKEVVTGQVLSVSRAGPLSAQKDEGAQTGIWVQCGSPAQKHSARACPFFTWASISGIYFFSVCAPPRLANVEFFALLTNIIEETWGKRLLIVVGLVNEVGMSINETVRHHSPGRTRPLEAVLQNTRYTPTFTGALVYSDIDLTFASDTLAFQIIS